jgi:hypothetical protein
LKVVARSRAMRLPPLIFPQDLAWHGRLIG